MTDTRLDDLAPDADRYDPTTVKAVGKLTEALEVVEEARGHLYALHRLTGRADFTVGEAVELFREAGHEELAEQLNDELIGRNVVPGRWTFQLVEDYEDTYYLPFRAFEDRARELTGGQRHLHEAELKRQRRSSGRHHHEATPDERAQ